MLNRVFPMTLINNSVLFKELTVTLVGVRLCVFCWGMINCARSP